MRNLLVVAVLLGCAQASQATLMTVTPSLANGNYIPGDCVPGGLTFWADISPNGEGAFLRIRNLDTGAPTSIDGNIFYVEAGYSVFGPPQMFIDFQFAPAPGSVPGDYVVTLQLDFDPGPGTSFVTLSKLAGTGPGTWEDTEAYIENPGGGEWSTNTVPFIIADSYHLERPEFASLPGYMPYNPYAPGEYQVNLFVTTPSGDPVVSTTVFARVNPTAVPEPATIKLLASCLLSLGFFGLMRLRRSR